MPYTTLQICNMALDEIRAGTISSLVENSEQADACSRHHAAVLGELLERHQWGFARKRAELVPASSNDRQETWAGAFTLPADLALPIKVLRGPESPAGSYVPLAGQTLVGNSAVGAWDGGWAYDYAGSTLYTSAPGAVLEYVENDASANVFSALFTRAFVLTLAARIVMPIKDDVRLKQFLMQQAEMETQRSIAADANRRPQTYGDFIPDVVRARGL